jgi:hypothetical protein
MGTGAAALRASVAEGRMRKGISLAVLAAALLAGPAEAACSSCCPSEAQRELALGTENCCGDECAPILERAPADSVPAGGHRSWPGPIAAVAVAPIPLPEPSAVSTAAAAFDLPPPLLLRPSQLRL